MEGRGEDEVTACRGDLLSEENEVEGRGELGEAAAGGFRGGGGVLERPPIAVGKRGEAGRQRESSRMKHQRQ